jgi:chromosome segregation ATPase
VQVKVPDDSGDINFICPCCKRGMTTSEEVEAFVQSMESLATDPRLIDDRAKEKYESLRSTYAKWRKTVQDKLSDIMDVHRLTAEASSLESGIATEQEELDQLKMDLRRCMEKEKATKQEVSKVSELLNMSRRWLDESSRIAQQRSLVAQKRYDLKARSGDSGRDLRTVEADIARRTEEKDNLASKVSRLNKEMSTLNNSMTKLSDQVRYECGSSMSECDYTNALRSHAVLVDG